MTNGPSTFGGVRVVVGPSATIWYVGLAIVGALRARALGANAVLVVAMGALTALSHLASLAVHHAGHALVARWTGYDMTGLRLWGPLASDQYPPDEPPLAATVHIWRALGGPLASATWMTILVHATSTLRPSARAARELLIFACVDNLFVFTLGAFVPLRFTDGGTLVRWWRGRAQLGERGRQ